MVIGCDGLPMLAELAADQGKRQAPEVRAREGIKDETAQMHAADAGWQGDEGPHQGQQPPHENDRVSMALEPVVGGVQILPGKEEVLAVPLKQWAAAERARVIRDERAQNAAERAEERHLPEPKGSRENEITGKWQDDLRGQRNAGAFDRH